MDHQELEEAVKSDLITISTLKLGILSARDLYGSLGMFVLRLSLVLLCINLCVQVGLHSIGLYYSPLYIDTFFACWVLTLIGSSFIMLFLSSFILFGKLVKGRLKTEGFIKKKCQQFSLLYLLIYGAAYLFLIVSLDAFGGPSASDRAFFGILSTILTLGVSQLAALIGSLLFMSVFTNIEVNRLGIGIAFDVINAFVARIKNTPYAKPMPVAGSDDNAR